MTFFDILCEVLAFERTRGYEITQIIMSLGYLISIESSDMPYVTFHDRGKLAGVMSTILGIAVCVDTEDKSQWIKYVISDHPKEAESR